MNQPQVPRHWKFLAIGLTALLLVSVVASYVIFMSGVGATSFQRQHARWQCETAQTTIHVLNSTVHGKSREEIVAVLRSMPHHGKIEESKGSIKVEWLGFTLDDSNHVSRVVSSLPCPSPVTTR